MAIMIGFLLQWPTIPTLVMFPILLLVYRRLAISEERAIAQRYDELWNEYARVTPRFIPHLKSPAMGVLEVTDNDVWEQR